MQKYRKLIFSLALTLLAGTFLSAKSCATTTETEVRFHPVSNFVHQLDCLSGANMPCSRANYLSLWQERFIESESDRDALSSWEQVVLKLGSRSSDSVIAGFPPGRKISQQTEVRIAGLRANSLDDYLEALTPLLNSAERATAEIVLNKFYPRFLAWWENDAKTQGLLFVDEMGKLMASEEIRTQVQSFKQFYEAPTAPPHPVVINLFMSPSLNPNEPSAGQQLGRFSLLEFRLTDMPKRRVATMIHEVCHYFFAQGPTDKYVSLESRFVQSGIEGATLAYDLLNEGVATALGNGMINRVYMDPSEWQTYVAADKSLYFDRAVTKAARALLPILDEYLKTGKTLYDVDFVARYTRALNQEIGDLADTPGFHLISMNLIADIAFKDHIANDVARGLRFTRFSASIGQWDSPTMKLRFNENKSALIIISADSAEQLHQNGWLTRAEVSNLQNAYKENKPAIYSKKVGLVNGSTSC